MNYVFVSNWRSQTAELFESLRFKAVVADLCAKISGKNTKLKGFAEQAFRLNSLRLSRGEPAFRINATRIYRGEQDLPVSRINGSVGREKDFDNHFRPLTKHLRDRWIDVYALFETDQVPPIIVYKYEHDYYVEDGHHRVSVARALGRLSIRAQVWEIPAPTRKTGCERCQPNPRERALAHA